MSCSRVKDTVYRNPRSILPTLPFALTPTAPLQVFEWVMCSDPKRDSHRFADLVREHLQREGSEPPARFVKWEKQVRKRRAPADPLAPRKRGKENRAGGQDDASLVALIRWVERGSGLGSAFL